MINTLAYPDTIGATSLLEKQPVRLATAALERSLVKESKAESSGELKQQTLELISAKRLSG
jgi:hypothetical protein